LLAIAKNSALRGGQKQFCYEPMEYREAKTKTATKAKTANTKQK
jgi:hypothetical protein